MRCVSPNPVCDTDLFQFGELGPAFVWSEANLDLLIENPEGNKTAGVWMEDGPTHPELPALLSIFFTPPSAESIQTLCKHLKCFIK